MDPGARARLIELHLPLVRSLARRFAHRGEPMDDLVQIGTIGLIGAIDRFERRRGCPLEAYAAASIVGEIKRHLRDRSGPLRVPRRLQEDGARVRAADRALGGRLGREPTPAELAGACALSEDQVERALLATARRSTLPLGGDGPAAALASHDFSPSADDRAAIAAGLRRLPLRDRRLLGLRFFGDLSQAEAGRALGISQVHVSRLERAALAQLRGSLDADARVEPPAASGGRLARVVGAAARP